MTASRRSTPKIALLLASVALLAAGAVAFLLATSGPVRRRPSRPPVVVAPVARLAAVESPASITDAAGGRWTPDGFSHGGTLVHSNVPIPYTSSPSLYRSERVGVTAVDVPVRANGSYLVVLYMAETRHAKPGQRQFDVLAQGSRVATVDVAGSVGQLVPYHLAFTATVWSHKLAIDFVARRGRPILSALRIQPAAPGLRLPATKLAFADEFNGPAGSMPTAGRWTYDTGPGWHQLADYTDQPRNASLDGHGHLLLTARNEPYADPRGGTYPITSARMTTKRLFEMRYGLAQARIQAAGQVGFVSTFWALGTDIDRVNFPRSGEIDPMEVRGLHPNVSVQALHMPCRAGECATVWGPRLPRSLATSFHTFAVERAPGVVIYSVDGRQTASLTSADVPRGQWVFDKPFYLLLNLIVGGSWARTPPPSTSWPVTMKVDWVRVYR